MSIVKFLEALETRHRVRGTWYLKGLRSATHHSYLDYTCHVNRISHSYSYLFAEVIANHGGKHANFSLDMSTLGIAIVVITHRPQVRRVGASAFFFFFGVFFFLTVEYDAPKAKEMVVGSVLSQAVVVILSWRVPSPYMNEASGVISFFFSSLLFSQLRIYSIGWLVKDFMFNWGQFLCDGGELSPLFLFLGINRKGKTANQNGFRGFGVSREEESVGLQGQVGRG